MEVIPKGNNFRIVSESELSSILDVLKNYLPGSIKFHETVKTYLKDKVWQFYFYVANEWPDVLDIVNYFIPLYERIGTIEQIQAEVYTYDRKLNLPNAHRCPDEVEIRALTLENVKDIHDLYPAGNFESVDVFINLIERLPGCGIFSKKDGELLAWMVQSYYGAMFSMQTKPIHRRKGYGIWLAKTLTEIVIKRGYLPYVVIRPENNASKGLYQKLGFQKRFKVVRAIFKPKED
uniref:CSON006971 protein n=1 Tax=Culicoides sonorensis TaxID=179676 RepID=A0A336LWW3_CULSO